MNDNISISSSRLVAPPLSERSQSVRESPNAGQSHWPGPGIFVRVEVGVSFSPTRSRQMSFGYTSKNMEDRVRNQRHLDSLVPGNENSRAGTGERQSPDEERRTRRRRIRSRSALQLRTSPVSPESVTLSPEQYTARDYHPFHPEPVFPPEPVFHPSPVSVRDHYPPQISESSYRLSPISLSSFSPQHSNSYPPPQTPQASSSRMPPFAAVRQSTIDRKPLPPLPSRFRLGSDDLPWSSPTIIDPDGQEYSEPSSISIGEPSERPGPSQRPERPARVEDPQRSRELEQLHHAMMGIDSLSLGNEWWEPGGSWDRQGDLGGLPRGPRGVGWAVAVPREEDRTSRPLVEHRGGSHQVDGQLSPPPAYSQGQWGWDWEWEERYGYWVRGLRRSSSVR
jgi:hypothetical protein